MPPASAYLETAAVLLFALAHTAAAHGHDEVSAEDVRPTINTASGEPESYSQLGKHGGMMFAHVALMTIAWVLVLPIGVMLSIAKSRRSVLVQFAFLCINALGLIFGIIYNAATPDLYPNNAHHKLGWVLTWIAVAQGFMALVNTYGGRWRTRSQEEEEITAFLPVSAEAMAEHQRINNVKLGMPNDSRFSGDSGHGTERNTESLISHSASSSLEHNQFDVPDLRREFEESDRAEKQALQRRSRLEQYLVNKLSGLSRFRILSVFDILYNVVDRVILILAFVAYTTGVITYSGIFKGNEVFSGLAHWIKGGIFFWYGILTLGRWTGCFADMGWAWNIKPNRSLVGPRKAAAPSAEFIESFLFFFYGSTNVFMEHLANWGGEWTATDLEHVAITILFMGGGLLGMLIESSKVRNLLNMSVTEFNQGSSPFPYQRLESAGVKESTDAWLPPKTYNFSMNPVPGIVIMLLGLVMSGHHQETMVSTTIHKHWGLFFVCVAMSRAVTYILFYLKPPTSYLPGRPPSEVVTAFCLMAGGAIFMGSARGVVEILILHDLGAMFVLTVTVGIVLMLMAWIVAVIAIKGWVVRRETKRSPFASFQKPIQEVA